MFAQISVVGRDASRRKAAGKLIVGDELDLVSRNITFQWTLLELNPENSVNCFDKFLSLSHFCNGALNTKYVGGVFLTPPF